MDGHKFDTIVKSLAAGTSRRRVLKGLGAGALGAFLGSRAADVARAAPVTPGTCDALANAGERCRTDAGCESTNPCCVGQCVRGNAGQGVGGNECQFTVRQCTRGRVPVVQGGRCRCAPASAA